MLDLPALQNEPNSKNMRDIISSSETWFIYVSL